jgi:hypothetical protein
MIGAETDTLPASFCRGGKTCKGSAVFGLPLVDDGYVVGLSCVWLKVLVLMASALGTSNRKPHIQ